MISFILLCIFSSYDKYGIITTPLQKEWKDFFKNSNIEEANIFSKQKERISPSFTGDIYIKESIFNEINNNESGGAIQLNKNSERVLIEGNSFISCCANSQGGGIYAYYTKGKFVLVKSCSYGCTASGIGYFSEGNGQFLYIYNENKIIVEDLSAIRTINENKTRIINSALGSENYKNTNFSSNICKFSSALNTYLTASLNISFLSFANNTDIEGKCLLLEDPHSDIVLKQCNILRNRVKNGNGMIHIRSDHNLNVESCCIILNEAKKYLKKGKALNINFINCTTDATNLGGIVTFISTPINTFVLDIVGYKTGKCDNSIDFIKDIATIEKTYQGEKSEFHGIAVLACILYHVIIK